MLAEQELLTAVERDRKFGSSAPELRRRIQVQSDGTGAKRQANPLASGNHVHFVGRPDLKNDSYQINPFPAAGQQRRIRRAKATR
jgi:hypothetical protein